MKKILALILAMAMVLSMAACGGTAEEPKTEAPAADAPAADAPAAEAPAVVTIFMYISFCVHKSLLM